MAYEIPGQQVTQTAGVSLAGSQYRAVVLNAAGLAVLPAAGGHIYGVVQNAPALSEPVTCMLNGVTKMVAGAAIPLLAGGTPVAVDAAGRAVPAAAGNRIIGFAEIAAAGAGIIISVRLGGGGVA